MKNPIKTLSLLSTASCLAFSSLSAVETDPVGYVSVDLPAGASLLTSPLTDGVQFLGSAGEVSGAVLALSGLQNVDGPAYLQVVSGVAEGQLSTIVSFSDGSVTLEESITGLSEGDSVRIVKHFTNGTILESAESAIPDNSSLTVYNSDGSIDSFTALAGDWYPEGEFVPQNESIIFPGEGFVLNLQAPVGFTFTGSVNTAPFSLPIVNGAVNIVGTLNPSEGTGANSVGAILSALGENSSITVYGNDGSLSVVETYTLLSGEWYAEGSFTPTEVTVTAPASVVVNPQTTTSVTFPQAY